MSSNVNNVDNAERTNALKKCVGNGTKLSLGINFKFDFKHDVRRTRLLLLLPRYGFQNNNAWNLWPSMQAQALPRYSFHNPNFSWGNCEEESNVFTIVVSTLVGQFQKTKLLLFTLRQRDRDKANHMNYCFHHHYTKTKEMVLSSNSNICG